MSPEPGSTSRPSSVITRALGPSANEAVLVAESPADTDWPSPIASDELKLSTSNMLGWWASRPFLADSDHMTPDEVISTTEVMSQRSGSASSADTIGLAKASPTMVSAPTFSASVTSSSSLTSKWRLGSDTTDPPLVRYMLAVNHPVPCISGQASNPGAALAPMFSRAAS